MYNQITKQTTLIYILAGCLLSFPALMAAGSDTITSMSTSTISKQSKQTPWGGSWWPMRTGELAIGWNSSSGRVAWDLPTLSKFDSCLESYTKKCISFLDTLAADGGRKLSPLMKIDLLSRKINDSLWGPGKNEEKVFIHATRHELNIHYIGDNQNHPEWESRGYAGKCLGWALSSMNHKEPTVHKEVLGIIFEPADLKGILATVYHGAQFFISDKNAVGNAYHNNSEANSEEYYEDVLPHDFLNALYKTIDKGKMIEADLEPGDGVWNYPIFKYELSWQQTSATQAVGTIRLYFANDEVDVDSVFSTESVRTDIKTRDLEFSLQMPPGWDGKDLRQATSGAWIGASREQHPDALILSIDKNWRSDILEYLEDDDFAANINTELFQEMMLPGEALGSIVDFLISAYY